METETRPRLRVTRGKVGWRSRSPQGHRPTLLPRSAGRRLPPPSCRRSRGRPDASARPTGSCPSGGPPCRGWCPGAAGSPSCAPAQSTLRLHPSLSTSPAPPKQGRATPSLARPPPGRHEDSGVPPGQRPARARAQDTKKPRTQADGRTVSGKYRNCSTQPSKCVMWFGFFSLVWFSLFFFATVLLSQLFLACTDPEIRLSPLDTGLAFN